MDAWHKAHPGTRMIQGSAGTPGEPGLLHVVGSSHRDKHGDDGARRARRWPHGRAAGPSVAGRRRGPWRCGMRCATAGTVRRPGSGD